MQFFIKKTTHIFFLFVVFTTSISYSQTSKDKSTDTERIKKLEQKILELEAKIKRLNNGSAPNGLVNTDSSRGRNGVVHSANGFTAPATKMPPQALTQQPQTLRQSQGMNPNISAIGTFLGTGSGFKPLERNYNLGLQEAEFAFKAVVDPYAKADFFIAAGRHTDPVLLPESDGHEGGGEDAHAADEAGGIAFELEEAYVTLLHLPLSTQVKAGKFRTKFGKLNETHPHAYHILDLPLMYQYFLGGEGFVDEGVSFRWLLPHSAFFQELTVQVLNGPDENFSFARDEGSRLVYLGHLKNFFDLGESTTLELGLLGATGPNNAIGERSNLFGADLTLKWKPLQKNRYRSFEWTSEFLTSNRDEAERNIKSLGWFSHLRYQIGKRWFLGGMAEYSEFPEFDAFNHKAYSGILQFFATEFQKFELQGRVNDGNFFDNFFDVSLRAVFVIGAHGAHQY